MSLRHKRKELQGVVGGLGVIAGLAGLLGFYSIALGILLAFAIWILGATLVILFTES